MVLNLDATWADAPDDSSDPVYSAMDLRRADAAMFAGAGTPLDVAGGIVAHGPTALQVTVDGSDNVTIQPGAVVIPGNAVTGTGVYRAGLGSAHTEALTARNATNPRIDRVVFRMLDTDVVGTHPQRRARVEIIAGAPAASPAAPALPSMAVELARITVPATGGGACTIDSTKRSFAAGVGGVLLVPTASQLPAAAMTWQRARALDTGASYTWDGAAWTTGAWKVWTPGGFTLGNGTWFGKYRVLDDQTCVARFRLTRGSSTNFTGSGGTLLLQLPVTPHADYESLDAIGTGSFLDASLGSAGRGEATVVSDGGNNAFMLAQGTLTNTAPIAFAAGDVVTGTVTFEVA